MVYVTDHAAKRSKERLGLPKRVTTKNAERALHYGIKHSETKGALRRYLNAVYLKRETANNIRIYSNNVYIWRRRTFNKKSILLCRKACWNSVVTIDYGSINICKNTWKRSCFNFYKLKLQRI